MATIGVSKSVFSAIKRDVEKQRKKARWSWAEDTVLGKRSRKSIGDDIRNINEEIRRDVVYGEPYVQEQLLALPEEWKMPEPSEQGVMFSDDYMRGQERQGSSI